MSELRRKTHISRDGVSLQGIIDAAESMGFRTLSVQTNFETLLNEAPLPCIIHWNQNHFVVVHKVKSDRVYIADPIGQKVILQKQKFLKHWTRTTSSDASGIALLLEPLPAFYENRSDEGRVTRKTFTTIFHYARLHRKFIVQLFIGLLLGSLIQLSLPFLTQSIVDIGINTRDIDFIYLILAGQLMLFFSRTTVDFIRRWILLHVSTRVNISIISDFLIKLTKLPLSFFDSKHLGDFLQRLGDHQRIQTFVSSSSLSILFSLFNLLVFGSVLLMYDFQIFAVFFLGSLIYALYVILFLKKRKALDYQKFGEMSANQSSIIQLIVGMPEIKLYGAERQKRWEWERIQAKLFAVDIAATRLQQFQEIGSFFINELKNIIITFLAAKAVIEGQMTLGMMLAVQYIIGQLNVPINEFINFLRQWQDAKIGLERITEIHNLADEQSDIGLISGSLFPLEKTIFVENLSFKYLGPHSPQVLNNVSFEIPEGKITAIVGASGSGKTTLLKLLLKFYLPSEGKIKLGGMDLNHFANKEWRQRCGSVFQDGYIFSDTIARNIAIAEDFVDRDKLMHAVTIANIREHIENLPLGYETKIGQDGAGLSHGQRQRLLIARAVYKNPEFLFFDEATSSLDANNEKVIMNNLNDFFQRRTVLVIAHRLSTVKNADNIIVLDKGTIVESGNHEALIARKGSYFELVRNQLDLGT